MQGYFIKALAIALGIITITGSFVGNGQAGPDRTEHGQHAQTSEPAGLALDTRGNLYTADQSSGHVFCIPPTAAPILLAQVPGTPVSMAVDRLRNVFVGTHNGRIFIIGLDGSVTEAYRFEGSPAGIEIDRDGGLIIVTGTGRIIRVNRHHFAFRR